MKDNIRWEVRRRKSVLTPMYLEMIAMMIEYEMVATACKRGAKDTVGQMYTDALQAILTRVQIDLDLSNESH